MSAIAIQAFLPFLSMVLAGVAASRTSAGPSDRPLKIALLYAGVFTEVLSELGVALWARDHTRHAPERMSERMALLTLIILGEGSGRIRLSEGLADTGGQARASLGYCVPRRFHWRCSARAMGRCTVRWLPV